MAPASRTTNATRPAGLLEQPKSLRINASDALTNGQVQQLYSECEVKLFRRMGPSTTMTGTGRESQASSNSSSNSGGKRGSKWANRRDYKGSSTATVCTNRKRREVRVVASRKKRNTSQFNCVFCEKAFPNTSRLEQHLMVHTRERPFFCSKCPQAFVTSQSLKLHVAFQHDKIAKRFKCHICGKKHHRKGHLKDHVRRHLGEKPYNCDICQMAFVSRQELGFHKTKHSSARPFNCTVCGSRFKHMNSFNRHRRDFHQEK